MKNKQTILAAGILGVLALLYYLTQTGSVDTKSIDVDQFKIDKIEITDISLTSAGSSIEFIKNESGWSLDDYPVDTVRMKQLMDQFSDLSIDRMVTMNPEKHSKYEVTDQESQFLASNGDGKDLLHLIIGKQGANYQETFVRADGENEVYAVKSNLIQYKNKTVKDFWDRTITQFDVNHVNQITFSGELNYSLNREGPVWSYDEVQVDFEKVVNMLRPLENLKASNFADEIGVDNTFYQMLSVGFEDGSGLELTFHLKDANGALLLVQVSGNNKIFEYSKSGLNRFKKEIAELLPDPIPTS
ncbi:MAG: DUF4340 domain-containing protein [Candidatus Marinimicrobia bacterium]|jgi:hypothetical protein|nr:DUF4340 domain-containing protein [Candidatus Neomarinimicrobiota bacterium]MBT3574914.1 DUF4340 domain-containing protein [Candidatus Neomarinimicrobiota bacterium]MBT3679703.1 DUF4340 domain-containing protein [Candidatus Neomarinimicrobiota bacterium]MBT3950806.1 DUF4340 domain-containing protein [Candidatus Neomarinimicrobiota bacterium]MBT4252397.1 DUF4340 domain-containing protein [Candidatus Neomarinimicrobiota bacterium]